MSGGDIPILKTQCYINGAWVGQSDWPVLNPATGMPIAHVPQLGKYEAEQAVEAAQNAFPEWARLTVYERSAVLKQFYSLIMAHKETLAQMITEELGKPLSESLGEVDYAARFVAYYAHEALRIRGEVLPTFRSDARGYVLAQPIGVVAAITPWNFPAAMITRKIAPALAAGCTVVVKPALETPLTALALAGLAQQAGFPRGVINVVTGHAEEIGHVLTTHPAVRFIGFTGSIPVGKKLMAQAAQGVKKIALELGGNAPFIVFPDADIPAAVEGGFWAKFRCMGQTCVCVNRFYIHADVYSAFLSAFLTKVDALKVGNGLHEGVDQGPLVNEAAIERLEGLVIDAREKGATVVRGGKRHSQGELFFEPTVLIDVADDMRMFQEEIFGPIAAFSTFTSETDVLQKANATSCGLAAYMYTRDMARITRVTEALEYGMIGVNSGQISSELCPFGGVKESGFGREGAHQGIEEFLNLKYTLVGGLHNLSE
jgi:succinate-semialdehyde dehydrogenase/glutarate-semialdehyde dehydrogenase